MRFCTRILAATTLIATLVVPQARAQSIGFGVLAGGSLSTFTGNTLSDIKHYTGFIAGAFVHLGLAGFSIQPGLYYTTKGAQAPDGMNPGGGVIPGETTELDYIQIPIVLRIGLGPLYVGAGPAISIRTGCKISFDGGTGDCTSDIVNPSSTQFNGIVEAGLTFGKVSLGGRADLGLTDVFTGTGQSQQISLDNLDIKTQTISAIISIRF